MPQAGGRVWTLGRQLVGNIVPLLIAGPFLFLGIRAYPMTGLSGSTLAFLVAFPVVGWLATNALGNCGSWGLKGEMERRLKQIGTPAGAEKLFVGFARPGYTGLLDPHEDVGFLIVYRDELEFFGSATRVVLRRREVRSVGHRANPHTWLGLGGWVSVDGESDGKAVRLLVEPREARTLLGNRAIGTRLREKLEAWSRASS